MNGSSTAPTSQLKNTKCGKASKQAREKRKNAINSGTNNTSSSSSVRLHEYKMCWNCVCIKRERIRAGSLECGTAITYYVASLAYGAI